MKNIEESYKDLTKEYKEVHGTLHGCPSLDEYRLLILKEMDFLDSIARKGKK